MSPRSQEFMEIAIARLALARAGLTADHAGAVSAAYYASLNAARAALSEHDRHARTHGGTWHLFREQFVDGGAFDQRLAGEAAALQKQREAADYEAVRPSPGDTATAVATAERFVGAVQAMLTDG